MTMVRSFETSAVVSDLFTIYITHLPTGVTTTFSGYVTEFSDQFQSNWNEESVYGRMDPLATFQNTQREISLSFDIPSGDFNQAQHNLLQIDKLIQSLYPVYEGDERTQQNRLKAAPLIGMRFSNLMASSDNGLQLSGYLRGVTYQPDMQYGGFFDPQRSVAVSSVNAPGTDFALPGGPGAPATKFTTTSTTESKTGLFVPKVVSMQLNYRVLHRHLTGWAPLAGPALPGQAGPTTFGNANADTTFPHLARSKTTTTTTTETTITPTAGGNTTQTRTLAESQVTEGGN